MEKLKKDLDKVIEEYADKGVCENPKCLEIVKTALSAKSKILTIEAMERVNEEGYGRGYDRRANGQFRDGGDYRDNMGRNYRDSGEYRDNMPEYRDGGSDYRDSGREYMNRILARADPHEKEFIERLMRKL